MVKEILGVFPIAKFAFICNKKKDIRYKCITVNLFWNMNTESQTILEISKIFSKELLVGQVHLLSNSRRILGFS